jgi:hypothetical protein
VGANNNNNNDNTTTIQGKGAAIQKDVLAQFVASANAAGVGYGFYYSIMKSFYLCHSFSGTNSCTEKVHDVANYVHSSCVSHARRSLKQDHLSHCPNLAVGVRGSIFQQQESFGGCHSVQQAKVSGCLQGVVAVMVMCRRLCEWYSS